MSGERGTAVAEKNDAMVCHCLKVTESAVLEAIRAERLRSVDDIRRCTQAGEGCTACHPLLARYLRRYAFLSGSPICSDK